VEELSTKIRKNDRNGGRVEKIGGDQSYLIKGNFKNLEGRRTL
jgi:hypothetical protein